MFRFRSLQKKVKLAIFFRNCTPLKYRGENSRREKTILSQKFGCLFPGIFCPAQVKFTLEQHICLLIKNAHTPTLSKNELGGWATKFIALFIFYRLF